MKRLFTSTLFAVAFVLSAMGQSAQFYYKGAPLVNGATVIINAEEDDWGDVGCETNPAGSKDQGLILKNLTSSDLNGTSKLTITKNTLAPTRVQWCMGGMCVQISGNTYDKDFSIKANNYIQVQFDAYPTTYGEMEAEIKATLGFQSVSVIVKFVNSDPNAKPKFVRRAVVEEYTGTWCGNCPRGIVGLQRLSEDFGDKVICIAVHSGNGEPLVIPTYPSLQPGDGIPACAVNRGGKVDPYSGSGSKGYNHYGIDADVQAAINEEVEAGLELTAQWEDDQQWDVRFNAVTTFNFNSDDASSYRLAFVLLEDDMKGEGSDWYQVNYYSSEYEAGDGKEYTDADMKFWREAPYKVTGMAYNHVPVQTMGIKNGIEGSIVAPIKSGAPQTFSELVTTLNVKVIQDKSKLSAVAMLLNTKTGRIVNAAKAAILPYGTSGIELTENRPATLNNQAVYDLQGRKVSVLSDGAAAGGQLKRGVYVSKGRKFVVK